MLGNTVPIERNKLLAEANEIIRQHEDYMHGMQATEVEQKGPVLVFRGEFFLDADGLPTAKTTAVFNMFKHLAHVLSAKYHLVD
ncbi:YciN family protein [Yersinia aleksiciae]|uniref:Protein yciN n=1 Tax=Yersinia aleksiciae TaxID=263819 RepID=A0A0T9T945_YERAE|nr:YciN family protein [Yersinia aleksiciae]MDA5499396.1 YciN family protein [Yersinia aleksiciae]MDN0122744.1 YciN family protein [Yersinia aleksiciae]NIK99009.1 YciN family protein [Yersinia aleksiciae]WQC72503.1 YciN family protein [Yersinia aleksiciae]CFQ55213.1 protein yciN [Yersinia aleksiciae]